MKMFVLRIYATVMDKPTMLLRPGLAMQCSVYMVDNMMVTPICVLLCPRVSVAAIASPGNEHAVIHSPPSCGQHRQVDCSDDCAYQGVMHDFVGACSKLP